MKMCPSIEGSLRELVNQVAVEESSNNRDSTNQLGGVDNQ